MQECIAGKWGMDTTRVRRAQRMRRLSLSVVACLASIGTPTVGAGCGAFIAVGLFLATISASPASAQVSRPSPTCGTVIGETGKDLENIDSWCKRGVVRGSVVSAYADGPLLTLKVSREMADEMRADRLGAEQLIRIWMKGWKLESGHRVVSLTVKWKDVEIATGQTTIFSGDQVTFRQ